MSAIRIINEDSDAVTIELPGLTAIRIDTVNRIVAIDGIGGTGTAGPQWTVADLRGGTYGDFHRLSLPDQCLDRDCIAAGEHLIAQED